MARLLFIATVFAACMAVLIPARALADPSLTVPPTGVTGSPVQFAATGDIGTLKFSWEFGDNSVLVEDVPLLGQALPASSTPSHTYAAAGTYPVKLTVTSTAGVNTELTGSITISDPPPPANQDPIARFTYDGDPDSPTAGDTVAFDASRSSDRDATGSIVKYEWDFGDGRPVFGAKTARRFSTAGTATITLQVTDDRGGTDTLTRRIPISPKPGAPKPPNNKVTGTPVVPKGNSAPRAVFTVSPVSPYGGEQVQLTSSSSDPDGALASQAWDFDNDGKFDDASGGVVSVVFRKLGRRVVRLRVTDPSGASDIATAIVVVRRRPAQVLFPFPVVRVAGRFTGSITRIKRFAVAAPSKAAITVRCKGRSCPAKRMRAKGKGTRKAVVFRRLQRRLRAGVKMSVTVTRGDRIGKVTVFRIRRNKPPLRADRCIKPGAKSSSRCPSR